MNVLILTDHLVSLERNKEAIVEAKGLQTFLVVSHDVEDDLAMAEASKTKGTCEWLTDLESFENWKSSSSDSPVFYWLTGEPGSGKTVLAAHIIRHLQSIGADVCFHFFRHGQESHQSASGFLRQIAYQMILHHPSMRRGIYKMYELGMTFEKDDERSIWRKFFMGEILTQSLQSPQYWILDGVDECVDVPKLFALLTKLNSAFPIRICFIGRRRPDLEKYLMKSGNQLFTYHIDISQTIEDIRTFLRDNSPLLPVGEEEAGSLIDRLVQKSRGIFLWAKLALDELEGVHSDESVDNVLDEVPEGMVPIYSRILEMMATNTRELKLTRAILAWAVCGARSLNIIELQVALELDLATSIKDVGRSVKDLCGQLLRIDRTETVHVIHATVRDFLLNRELESPLAIQNDSDHRRLASVCLQYLISDEMGPPRNRLLVQNQAGTASAFTDYACTMFSEHVATASADSSELVALLHRFFRTNVLTWIEFIARHRRDLSYVIRTAQNIRRYLDLLRAKDISRGPTVDNYCNFIEQWSTDMVRIVTKFSRNLLKFPSSIFYLVAPLCPEDSAISRQFKNTTHGFSLKRTVHNIRWDECVSYIDCRGERALSLTASDISFAIGMSTGHIRVYDADTCQQSAEYAHGERVTYLQFDNSARRLLASGRTRLSMFSQADELLWTFEDDRDTVIMASFSATDDIVTVLTRNRSVMYFSAMDGKVLPSEILGRADCRQLKADNHYVIRDADISLDQKIMAIAYGPSVPVQLWSLERDISIGSCWFKGEAQMRPYVPTLEIVFNRNPAAELLAVARQDGMLGIFDAWTGQEVVSVAGDAYMVACAPGGRILATCDMRGTIKLWEFETLRLLYCMRSDEYDILSLAFNGTGSRLYDMHVVKTKVWEPSVLLRKDLAEDLSINATQPEEATERNRRAADITDIAAMGDAQSVLVGRADGSVELFDTSNAELQKVVLYHHDNCIGVHHLSLSAKGYLATIDIFCCLQISSISKNTDNTMKAKQRKAMGLKTGGPVRGMEWSPSGSKLLVCQTFSDFIYWVTDFDTESAPYTRKLEGFEFIDRKWAWLPHPSANADVAMLCHSTLYLYQTDEEARDVTLKAKFTLTFKGQSLDERAGRVAFGKSSKFLAVEIGVVLRFRNFSRLLVYCLDHARDEPGTSPNPNLNPSGDLHVLEPLLNLGNSTFRIFIGWHNDFLVYLDMDHWICSVDMASIELSDNKKVYTRRRHLFIPYEFISGANWSVEPRLFAGTSIVFSRGDTLSVIEGALLSVFMTEEVTEEVTE